MLIGPDKALVVLQSGGYFERKDERLTQRSCIKMTTRLYTVDGIDCGVANYARKRLLQMCKIVEIKGSNGLARWVLKGTKHDHN